MSKKLYLECRQCGHKKKDHDSLCDCGCEGVGECKICACEHYEGD